MVLRSLSLLFLSGLALVAGCGGPREVSEEDLRSMAGGELSETVPVSGTVTIDGSAAQGVNIYAYTQDGTDAASRCRTLADGSFCFTTHARCDGMQPGTYRLAFAHVLEQTRRERVDQLQGKYQDPLAHDFELIVETGKPQTELTYELTSPE